MLIVGAKGFAKEVLEVCRQNKELNNLVFYDDINDDIEDLLYNQFPVLKSLDNAKKYFDTIDKRFTIGIGSPVLRKKLYKQFKDIGGIYISTISQNSNIGSFDININEGCNVLDGVKISNSVKIGKGCIVYYNSIITHDCIVGDFVEISPNTTLLGRSIVGNYCQIGSGSIILPDICIGENVIVGAGSVVTKNLPDNCTAVGTPAKIIKQN